MHDTIRHAMPEFVDVAGGSLFLRDEGTKASWLVRLPPYALSSTVVTEQLWSTVMDVAPEGGARRPKVDVSWGQAATFCNRLSNAAGLSPVYTFVDAHDAEPDLEANGYRLPQEAEWEFACRAGANADEADDLDAVAWHRGNANDRVHDVGTKAANPWGFHDLLGNVWEWCSDLYDPQRYGRYRVFRGGGFADGPRACRPSCRRKSHPAFHIDDLGFRIAQTAT